MENVVDYLKQLDLSDIEAKIYLTLLGAGPSSVRDVAQTIDIKRTTTYFYIDQLVEKGLIMKLVKGSKKLVAANEPDNLKPLVDAKRASAKVVEQDFPKILKILNTSFPKLDGTNEAEIKYYKGKAGVRRIYQEALKSNELRSYVNIADVESFFPENAISFEKAFENNKDFKLHEFIEYSPASLKLVKILSQSRRYNYKFLPKNIKISASDILLYDGKVAIINLRESTTGVVFHNKDYYNISKELFEYMWGILPGLDKFID